MKVTLQYRRETLSQMLSTGKYKRVMIQFYHGLGDAISFYANCLNELRKEFPQVEFFFHTLHGQEEMFGQIDPDESHYDLAVRLGFPCSEWDSDSIETKSEKCMRTELGISGRRQCEIYHMPREFGSPLVGVHYFSTSSEGLSVNDVAAKRVWDAILDRGLIPIDTHFIHPGCQIRHEPFSFEDRTVAGIRPTVGKVFGLIRSLSGFCGVSGGNFWTALCCLPPECILYLETEFPAEKLTRLPVKSYDGGDDMTAVHRWLDCIVKMNNLE